MTKEEKIKEAYGRFFKPEKYHFSVNGWVDLNEWSENEVGKLIDEIDMEFREYSARPKSLQGIEDNNGWIKIESEDDLPKEGMTNYFICVDGKPSIHVHNLRQVLSLFKDGMVSHYQPIVKPKPPIY